MPIAEARHQGPTIAVDDACLLQVGLLELVADADDALALDQDIASVSISTCRVDDIDIEESDNGIIRIALDLKVARLDARVRLGEIVVLVLGSTNVEFWIEATYLAIASGCY